MDTQQELYTAILVRLREIFGSENVYDGGLPPEGTPYPFVYMGDVTDSDEYRIKDNLETPWGRTDIRIHCWHNKVTERGTMSETVRRVKEVCREVASTENYVWQLRGLTSNILPDNTTKTPLLHGVVDATYTHY